MTTARDVQELARRFNENEAVWQRFERLRALRLWVPSRWRLPEQTQDRLDWQAAEREARPVRAVGIPIPHP